MGRFSNLLWVEGHDDQDSPVELASLSCHNS